MRGDLFKMVENNLEDKINDTHSNSSCLAVIISGSDSDKEHINKITASLEKYFIPYQVRICSAHKQPEKLMQIIEDYNKNNTSIAYISVAGGTDALSGMLSYHALAPVISCPPDGFNQSCLTNPAGSSNAFIAKPDNVARFIAQMYSSINPKYKVLLIQENAIKNKRLETADDGYTKNKS